VNPCPIPVSPWWQAHPAVGWFIVFFGLVGVLVPLLREKIGRREKSFWTAVLVFFALLELRTIHNDAIEHEAKEEHDRCVQLDQFKTIADGIKEEVDNTRQILDLERQSRVSAISPSQETNLIKMWGQVSKLKTKAVEGAIATSDHPAQIQKERRTIDAERLGAMLNSAKPAAATVINDGTNEAGNFANQLVIGLRFGGWQAGGDNIKMGDPAFFPDSLTIEVSTVPVSPEDRSIEEANALKNALKAQGTAATIRYTVLAFPPNFMRIKVAGQ